MEQLLKEEERTGEAVHVEELRGSAMVVQLKSRWLQSLTEQLVACCLDNELSSKSILES